MSLNWNRLNIQDYIDIEKLESETIRNYHGLTHFHCKLTRRRRSNSIYITVTTLWPRSSSMSDLSHMCKKSKFIQLHPKNSKRFCSFQYLFNKKVMIKSIYNFNVFFAFYFSLACFSQSLDQADKKSELR